MKCGCEALNFLLPIYLYTKTKTKHFFFIAGGWQLNVSHLSATGDGTTYGQQNFKCYGAIFHACKATVAFLDSVRLEKETSDNCWNLKLIINNVDVVVVLQIDRERAGIKCFHALPM